MKAKKNTEAKELAWEDLQNFIINEGAEKYLTILKGSDDATFIRNYLRLLEYFKPKLQKIDGNVLEGGIASINFVPAEKQILKKVGT